MPKLKKIKWDLLGDFQTMCLSSTVFSEHIFFSSQAHFSRSYKRTYISTRAVASLISVEVIEYLFSLTFGSGDELGASSISTGLNSLTSSGMPTPSSGTRPGSQTNSTNSYIQSCSSQMSGVDDRRLDEILADGIQNQVPYFLTCLVIWSSRSASSFSK